MRVGWRVLHILTSLWVNGTTAGGASPSVGSRKPLRALVVKREEE